MFFGPNRIFFGPRVTKNVGGLACVFSGPCGDIFFGPACIWELVHVFLDLAQGGGNLDTETRCMQEAVDAGEVPVLKQQKRKKWWRGQWGKSTYEAKWMQEIDGHIGERESSILKQGERKKLLRDEG